MLRQPDGASIDEIIAATGWQPHTVRVPSPARQDAVAIERRLEGEVEAGERLDGGQPGQQQRGLDAAVLADSQFLDEQVIEGFDVARRPECGRR